MAAGENLLLPVAGGSSDPSEFVWTLNAATGRELLYVVFTPAPLTESQLVDMTRNPETRSYATRGFESHGNRIDECRDTASWQTVSEDYRAKVLKRIQAVTGESGFVSESVLYHVR